MTTIYQWWSMPRVVSVSCPGCQRECRAHKGVGNFVEHGVFMAQLSCLHCGLNKYDTVHWLRDAFWQFEIKGQILWAYTRDHAVVFLKYLESQDRIQRRHFGFWTDLLHMPKHFKLAKNRKIACKIILRKLQKS